MVTWKDSWRRRCNSNPDPFIKSSIDGSAESWLQACRSNAYPDPGGGRRPRRSSKRDPLLPDKLLWEILTRLPVKSLMRFSCVSRLWRSIILDPVFAREHQGGFRGLLISGTWGVRLSRQTDFYYVNIHDSKVEISHHLTVDHGGKLMGSTDVVKGLVCFYDHNHCYCYNIATRERMELPFSGYESQSCSYHLGFDPVNKVYKLLKICPVYDYYGNDVFGDSDFPFPHSYLHSEILTIGVDSSWRSIDPAPWKIKERSICYNGVLHWMQYKERSFFDRHLIAFSLAKEKFRSIYNPRWRVGNVLRFGHCLAVEAASWGMNGIGEVVEIYECGGDGSGVWTQFDIIYPKNEFEYNGKYTPKGTLPDGKILFSDSLCNSSFPRTYYLYNRTNKQFEKILIPESPVPQKTIERLSYHEENIVPLNCLNSLL